MTSTSPAFAATLRDWRRHLHQHPELSGEEESTAAFVSERLRELGYAPRIGVGETHGVIAELPGPGRAWVALRADMDALPIQEESDLPYASQNPGVMHACGHDAHTAMLLGAARLLMERRAELPCSVRLIFQPHEEAFPGGAPAMIAAGALEGVESIFGLHISSQLPTGLLGTRTGALMAGLNRIEITVRGRGGHAAMPEECVDPILAASQIVVALQSVVSRSLAMTDSAVVSITQFHAGTADNIIPQEVRLQGTIRVLSEQVRAVVLRRVRETAEHVARACGATVDIDLPEGYPVLVNDAGAVRRALAAARDVGFTPRQLFEPPPMGGAEDFAYYCQKTAGAFAFLGARNDALDCVYPHHHPRFNIDESALPHGAALLAAYVFSRDPG